eukprot:m.254279 g.254279  ORF g.254279 m.254279 type:complete len:97 (-) comp16170_c1_seq8:729-1019(-)
MTVIRVKIQDFGQTAHQIKEFSHHKNNLEVLTKEEQFQIVAPSALKVPQSKGGLFKTTVTFDYIPHETVTHLSPPMPTNVQHQPGLTQENYFDMDR